MKSSGAKYDLDKMAVTMTKVAAFMRSLPPSEVWQPLIPSLDRDSAIIFEWKWKALGYQLDAFYSGRELLPKTILTESAQRFLNVYTNYYLQLGVIVFQALPYIKVKFAEIVDKQLGIKFPKQRSDLLKALILEDCLEAIDLMSMPFWESPSEREVKQLQQICINYFHGGVNIEGKIKPVEQLSTDENEQLYQQISGIYQKLNWTLPDIDSDWISWNDLCREVFLEYRKELPAYNAWVDATNQKFTVEKWLKQFWQAGKRTNYPGRGKTKKRS